MPFGLFSGPLGVGNEREADLSAAMEKYQAKLERKKAKNPCEQCGRGFVNKVHKTAGSG